MPRTSLFNLAEFKDSVHLTPFRSTALTETKATNARVANAAISAHQLSHMGSPIPAKLNAVRCRKPEILAAVDPPARIR
jgi:hypothetical protein